MNSADSAVSTAIDQIYGKIEEELRSQYSLGYTPDANALNGYRRITIAVQREGMGPPQNNMYALA